MIDVYILFVEDFDVKYSTEYLQFLTIKEKATLNKFVFETDKHSFMLTQQLKQRVLAQKKRMSLQNLLSEQQKLERPYSFESNKLTYSIACDKNIIVLTINNEGPTIGADIKKLGGEISQEVFKQVFTRLEIKTFLNFSRKEQQERFLELWALKEAFIKATGKGMPIDPLSFSFNYGTGGFHLQSTPSEFASKQLEFELLNIGGKYKFAVCHNGLSTNIKSYRILPNWEQAPYSFANKANV